MNIKKKVGQFIERRTIRNLKKEITKHVSGQIILDNGCGSGSFIYEKHKERAIYGIDIRPPANQANYPGIFKTAESTKLPFKNNMFDCVVFAGVIQYIKDYDIALEEIKRVLRKNGKLIISTVNRDSLLRRIRIINPAPKKEAGEYQILSINQLEHLVNNHKLIIEKSIGVDMIKLPKHLCSNSLLICKNEK